MKKLLAIALLAVFALSTQAFAKKAYVNGIDPNYPPFAYVDEKTGQPAGFDVDSMNWIAKTMGFAVEHKPMAWDGIIPAIQNANNKGTPTICFGIKANGGDFIFVGSNSYDAGHMQGELMAEMLPENAKVCYLAGTAGLEHSILRRQGFQEALAEAGRDDVEIIEDQDAQYTKAKAMEKVDAWVQKYADGKGGVTFDAVVAANDQMALGAVESLKGANILKGNNEILISGIDGTPDGVAAVANGYMVQTVLQDAAGQAKAGLEAVDKIMAGEQIPGNEIMVPFVNITQDNVADFQ